MEYKGITEKILKDGTINYYVRFKYLNVNYGVRNFTKLFNCKTQKQTYDKLQEVKFLIRDNKNPFLNFGNTLDDYFYRRLQNKINSNEWSATTQKNYKYFYETIIKKKIGHRTLNKITYTDLEAILESINHTKGTYKNNVKNILNPIFEESIKREEIHKNPCKLLKLESLNVKESLSNRTKETHLELGRKLYKEIKNYHFKHLRHRGELNMFFMLVLLSGHRYGEILKLNRDNVYIGDKLIISPKEITKSREEYKFPLPKELIEYVESIKAGQKLFPHLKYTGVYYQFQNVVRDSEIELYRDKKISLHDIRRIMLNVMISDCKIDSALSDFCLEHKQQNVIKHYLDYTDKDKKKAFKKYWKKIRNNDNKKKEGLREV